MFKTTANSSLSAYSCCSELKDDKRKFKTITNGLGFSAPKCSHTFTHTYTFMYTHKYTHILPHPCHEEAPNRDMRLGHSLYLQAQQCPLTRYPITSWQIYKEALTLISSPTVVILPNDHMYNTALYTWLCCPHPFSRMKLLYPMLPVPYPYHSKSCGELRLISSSVSLPDIIVLEPTDSGSVMWHAWSASWGARMNHGLSELV
jgi:hypothetical protein